MPSPPTRRFDLEPVGLQPSSPGPPGRRARRGPSGAAPQVRTLPDDDESGPLSPGLPAPTVPRHLARAPGGRPPDASNGRYLVPSLEVPGHAPTGASGYSVTQGRVGRQSGPEGKRLHGSAYNVKRVSRAKGGVCPKSRLEKAGNFRSCAMGARKRLGPLLRGGAWVV